MFSLSLWYIWKNRNAKIFGADLLQSSEVFEQIRTQVKAAARAWDPVNLREAPVCKGISSD